MRIAYMADLEMIQVNKQKAKRLYNEGEQIYIIPCKASRSYGQHKHNGHTVAGFFWTEIEKAALGGADFDKIINQCLFYSPQELGKYLNYYILKES